MSATACVRAPNVNAQPIASYTLPLNADCLIDLPSNNQSNKSILVGCYQLDESSRSKDGSINKFRIDQSATESNTAFQLIDSLASSAIFDLALIDQQNSLAVDSAGSMHLINHSRDQLIKQSSLLIDEDCLCYVDYQSNIAAIGQSNGSVKVVQVDSQKIIQSFNQAHYDSVWCTLIDRASNAVYSGSDDCELKLNDIRSGASQTINQSSHSAGICHLSAHPTDENLVASGSYDEKLRLFDVRNWRSPVSEVRMGGGVWRITWRENTVAASCMHNGAQVVEYVNGAWSQKASYYGHESLVYGCLFLDDKTLASCSFYDKSLHMWKIET